MLKIKTKQEINKGFNKFLIKKYPFLKPTNAFSGPESENYDYSYTLRDNVPVGWLNLFDKFCEDFKAEYDTLSEKQKNDFFLADIKEAYGSLNIYPSFLTEKMARIIHYYEVLSFYTCAKCGRQTKNIFGNYVIWTSRGHILPFCKKCAKHRMNIFEDQKDSKYSAFPKKFDDAYDKHVSNRLIKLTKRRIK